MALFGSSARARLGQGDLQSVSAPDDLEFGQNPLARMYGVNAPQPTPSISPELQQSLAQNITAQPLALDTPKLKAPFFSKYGAGPNVLGMMGDFLLQQSGMQPMYLPMMKFRQDNERQALENDYRRAATDELRRKGSQVSYEKVGNDLVSVSADGRVTPIYSGSAEPSSLQRNFEWFKGLPPEDQAIARPMLSGYQYTPQGIAAATDRASAVATAQGKARQQFHTPSRAAPKYTRGSNGRVMKWVP